MSDLLRNIIRFIIFIGVQVYVLDKIPPLHRYVSPTIYYLFILWLPFAIPRFSLLVIGFITGLTIDYFSMTPGEHAAACVLIAYARPYVINILSPKEKSDFNYGEPSSKGMGWAPYATYVFILTVFHHGYFTFLQWLQFGGFVDFIVQIFTSTAISLLLIFTVELLFPRKLKFRTNTA